MVYVLDSPGQAWEEAPGKCELARVGRWCGLPAITHQGLLWLYSFTPYVIEDQHPRLYKTPKFKNSACHTRCSWIPNFRNVFILPTAPYSQCCSFPQINKQYIHVYIHTYIWCLCGFYICQNTLWGIFGRWPFLVFLLIGDNCFTVLCWFLPWVRVCLLCSVLRPHERSPPWTEISLARILE